MADSCPACGTTEVLVPYSRKHPVLVCRRCRSRAQALRRPVGKRQARRAGRQLARGEQDFGEWLRGL